MGISTEPTKPTVSQPGINHDYSSPEDDPRCESESEAEEGKLAHHKVQVSALAENGDIVKAEQLRAAKRAEELRAAIARDNASILNNVTFLVGFGVTLGVVSLALGHAIACYYDKMGYK